MTLSGSDQVVKLSPALHGTGGVRNYRDMNEGEEEEDEEHDLD
jgi:hypothetical protein